MRGIMAGNQMFGSRRLCGSAGISAAIAGCYRSRGGLASLAGLARVFFLLSFLFCIKKKEHGQQSEHVMQIEVRRSERTSTTGSASC